MSVTCPIITITAPAGGGTECYRGYILYKVSDIPTSHPNYPTAPWVTDPTYANWYAVFWDSPIFNVTGDKPFWFAQQTIALLKQGVDLRITNETPYKTNPEGTQC